MPFYRVGDVGLLFGATAALAVDLAASPSPPPPPPPPPPPDGLTVALSVKYLDTSGNVQEVDASDGETTITVDAPAYIRFDASDSRSEEDDADDKPGAMLYLGYEWDFGEPLDEGDWPFAGPQGAVKIGRERRAPRAAHVYTLPGTRTARVRVKDSADREVTTSVTVVVRDPLTNMTRVDLTTGSGAWPTLQSNRVYTLNGNYSSWGVPNLNGLTNIVFMPHPDATSAPTIAGLTLDTRVEANINTTITRPRGIRVDGINVGPLRWGITGFDWCSVSNGRVSSCGASISQSYVYDEAIANSRGATVANNIRLPVGLCLWNTGECNSYGSYVLITADALDASFYGVDFHKNDGNANGSVVRGPWKRAIFRHCRWRCTGSATGYGRFEGRECRSANGNMPDDWSEDGTLGNYAGGYRFGYAAEDCDVTNSVMGAAGETRPNNGIGTGPENNDAGWPAQGQRYCYFENVEFYDHGTNVSAAFGGGLWVGARHLRYSTGGNVSITWNNGGTGNPNRLPAGENGPNINETTSTRPVPTPFED